MEKEKEAFQDLIGPENHCHGCGCANEKGLQLKSYWDGDAAVAVSKPQPHHSAGMARYVNGGIVASIMDCHGNNLAMALAYHESGRGVGSLPKLWCVTASLKIDFKLPIPIDQELHLRAQLREHQGKKYWIDVQLFANDKLCAVGELLQIQVERKE
jgi:acyl-coenzyme A thioesterase PaaI-like protein